MKTEQNQMNRRDALKWMGLGIGAAVVAITIKPQQSHACEPSLRSTIGTNHGHTFEVPLKDLVGAGPRAYSIKGKSGHDHVINLTEEALKTLNTNKVIEVESTLVAGHVHIVRLEII